NIISLHQRPPLNVQKSQLKPPVAPLRDILRIRQSGLPPPGCQSSKCQLNGASQALRTLTGAAWLLIYGFCPVQHAVTYAPHTSLTIFYRTYFLLSRTIVLFSGKTQG